MNKKLKNLLLYIVCISMFSSLFTSCSSKKQNIELEKYSFSLNEVLNPNAEFQDEKVAYQVDFSDYGNGAMNFQCDSIMPNSFYEISLYIYSEDLQFGNQDSPGIYIKYESDKNNNSDVVFSNDVREPTTDKNSDDVFEWKKLTLTVYSYDNDKINFSLVFGDDTKKGKGTIYVDDISVKNIKDLNNYSIVNSNDDSIIMVLKKKIDNQTHQQMKLYLDRLSDFRKVLTECVSDDYTYGKTIYLVTQNIDAFGYAGLPIYLNNEELDRIISSALDYNLNRCFDIITYAMLHEMSHTFDRICGEKTDRIWQFNSEVLANAKSVYVLDKLKINCDNVLNQALKTNGTEIKGIYSDEYASKLFIEIGRKNWSIYKKVFSEYQNQKNLSLDTDYKKFCKFVELYNHFSSEPLESLISKKDWIIIKNYYKNV